MSMTLTDLERRLVQVEQEVAQLRGLLERAPHVELPFERGERLLAEATMGQQGISRAVSKAFQEMGIKGKPVGPEELHQMMAAEGVKAEDNAFSREIEAMREE